MRIAIVDDLSGERALLREQLARQLARRGAEAELLEFDSGEAFLAAEKERRFTAAFLDIYMEGMTGMEAARALRKTDTDCLLVFTTTSTDHALEGFQVRALHYLVKPFAEGEIDALTDELLTRVPQPEKFMELRVEGGEIRLRYRDIIRAEHFAHVIYVHTTAGKTLATRQSFKAFTAPLKEDPRFFVCGRGVIVNLEHAEDFGGRRFPHGGRQLRICQSGASKKCAAVLYGISAGKGAHVRKLRCVRCLELLVVSPGLPAC